jgi:hypothetical protein
MRLLPVLVLVLLAAAPAAAQEPTAPVTPSEVKLFPVAQTTVDLSVTAPGGYSAWFHASTLTDALGGLGELTLPASYLLCHPLEGCERHSLFPGLRLAGHATSTSAVQRITLPDGSTQELSAQRAQRLTGVVGPVPGLDPLIAQDGARSQPRRLRTASGRVLRKLRWSGWGQARARAGGVRASRLVDCGGELFYGRVRHRGKALPLEVPCGTGRQVHAR